MEIFQPKGVFAGKVISRWQKLFPPAKSVFARMFFLQLKQFFSPTSKNLRTMDQSHIDVPTALEKV